MAGPGISFSLAERVRLIQSMAGWSGTAFSSRRSRPLITLLPLSRPTELRFRDVVKVHSPERYEFVRALQRGLRATFFAAVSGAHDGRQRS